MKHLIQKLVETVSPSGYEAPIRKVIREEIENCGAEIRVDALGNLIAVKGSPEGKKIMLSAHMDEIGLIVTHIDENGFVRFLPIGGVSPSTCIGGRVRFLNGKTGIIFQEKPDEPGRVPAFDRLYIDVGAADRSGSGLRVGDVGVFDRPFWDLGDRLVSKAMDDRVGAAVLIETLKQLDQTPNQVSFVFSTQEEVGLRGATTAAFGIDPDIALSVDVTGTGDTPKGSRMAVSLGKGPAIKVRDGGMLSDPRIIDWMVKTAESSDIPYQLEILEGGTTDARAMQLTRAGVPAGCLSVPCRYIHSPSEMVDYNDVQNAVRLMLQLIAVEPDIM
jgi:endoglucanase